MKKQGKMRLEMAGDDVAFEAASYANASRKRANWEKMMVMVFHVRFLLVALLLQWEEGEGKASEYEEKASERAETGNSKERR